MFNTLQFNMSVPTTYVFMKRFLKAAQADRKVSTHFSAKNLSLFFFKIKTSNVIITNFVSSIPQHGTA